MRDYLTTTYSHEGRIASFWDAIGFRGAHEKKGRMGTAASNTLLRLGRLHVRKTLIQRGGLGRQGLRGDRTTTRHGERALLMTGRARAHKNPGQARR